MIGIPMPRYSNTLETYPLYWSSQSIQQHCPAGQAMIDPRIGAQYRLDGQIYEVISITDDEIAMCSLIHNYHRFIAPIDFQLMADRGQLTLHQCAHSQVCRFSRLPSLKESERQLMEYREIYVKVCLNELGGRLPKKRALLKFTKTAKKFGHTKPPSLSAVRKWKDRYISANCNPEALLRQRASPPTRQFHPEMEELIKHYLKTVYLTPERPSLMHTYKLFKGHVKNENCERARVNQITLSIPSYYSMRRRALKIDKYHVVACRYGPKEANRRNRASGHLFVDKNPFAATYFDSHDFDCMVIDERTGLRGRPVLCCHLVPPARYLSGWDIDFGAPCAEKMMRATIQSILNQGKPCLIITDHGPEILNVWALTAFDILGIKTDYVPVDDADAKAIMERFFKTVKDEFCNTIPGFTHGSPSERGDYPSEERACLTLTQFREAFATWLVAYHNTKHSSLNMTPNEMMAKLTANAAPAEHYLPEELEQLCLSQKRRKLDGGRVHMNNLQWSGKGLNEIRQRLKAYQTAIVYFNPCDLGKVWVAHPDTPDDRCPAVATRPEYQNGLTYTDHLLVLAKLKKEGVASFNGDIACVQLLKLKEFVDACKADNAKKGLLPKKNKSNKKQRDGKMKNKVKNPTINQQFARTSSDLTKRENLDSDDFPTYQLPEAPYKDYFNKT
ncbi:DNA-binding domain-containing protein [Pseudomonas sp. RC2C2]|uniref:DNA-binding domain-containing protein n=1 Tax=Pseudomonas sp. RC2C2 TaxID=2834408 RepID=UPI001BCF5CAC|nr:DNA-binding domain-containing protein [Pseudomonas sp. RC2C2]MBS7596909.1 hypothetical protein [Pseudomonas sp. RC2C2]